ncbi:hypothetical protein CXG81DRAFT_10642 [Caulochytrium protostelioides]|uniref:Protein kinase domain-containing protein n=1 Tax=Caulochytrium protostelioides TaxID=1555241 RepID=A0A4P9XB51_9FUNG|nr:hypothetical protein CXG81DRAFT_10642 [Caulochytrium protostelioides]|eukprot:RKP02585.1 hypothetical protein CXG81DRAFT_10642 [Caulochytrium protostelioides]
MVAAASRAAQHPLHHANGPVSQVGSGKFSCVSERYLHDYTLDAAFTAQYLLGDELGCGGFGFVCSAIHRRSGVEVAVKFVLKRKIPSRGWVFDPLYRGGNALPSEIAILRRLSHDNIVRFLDFYEDAVFFYVVTEYHGTPWATKTARLNAVPLMSPRVASLQALDRPSLSQAIPCRRRSSCDLFECIEQHERFTEMQAQRVFGQIVSAIYHLHSRGYVHRDLKDENCLVDRTFTVKLVDFGSAAPLPDGSRLFDRFLGTVQYAAPEILRGEKYRGPEAEVWALGCCLYIMLSGEVPFVAPAQALHGTFTPCRYPLSPACLHLLGRLLEKSDRRRITILEVVQHPWLRDYVTLV